MQQPLQLRSHGTPPWIWCSDGYLDSNENVQTSGEVQATAHLRHLPRTPERRSQGTTRGQLQANVATAVNRGTLKMCVERRSETKLGIHTVNQAPEQRRARHALVADRTRRATAVVSEGISQHAAPLQWRNIRHTWHTDARLKAQMTPPPSTRNQGTLLIGAPYS